MKTLKLRTGLSQTSSGKQVPKKEREVILIIEKAIARICKDTEQLRGIARLLVGLSEKGVGFHYDLSEQWLALLDIILERKARLQRNAEAAAEDRKRRDNLTGRDREDFVLELMQNKDHLTLYGADFQRTLLTQFAERKLQPSAGKADETKRYLNGKLLARFDGCSPTFRCKVIKRYLNEILPPIEVEQQKEQALQDIYDSLLDAVSDKTLPEIAKIRTAIKEGVLDSPLCA